MYGVSGTFPTDLAGLVTGQAGNKETVFRAVDENDVEDEMIWKAL